MIILSLVILCAVFWLGIKITGTLLSAFIWLIIKLPCMLVLWAIGFLCFCTIILFPVGIMLFRASTRIAFC